MSELAGRLLLRPGGQEPPLRSTRRDWAPVIGQNRPAGQLPGLLASVFSLCGGAHRVACELAVAAARGDAATPSDAQRESLRTDTLREHLRRWWVDGPLLTGEPADAAAVLSACPAFRTGAPIDLDVQRLWVEQQVLGSRSDSWLAAWANDPLGWAQTWARSATTLPARALQRARQALDGVAAPVRALDARDLPGLCRALSPMLDAQPGFALLPTLGGRPAETGAWTRALDPWAAAGNGTSPYSAAWMRVAARIADVARLVQPPVPAPAPGPLACGAVALAAGEGFGWCEMARGLLLHRVRLGPEGRVADCRVIAPTEWNFHPDGAMAHCLCAQPVDAPESRLRWLALAFDPCVEVGIDRPGAEVRDA